MHSNTSLFALPPFLAGTIILILGWIIYKNNPKLTQNKTISAMCLGVTIWLYCYSLNYFFPNNNTLNLFLSRFSYLGVTIIWVTYLHFTIAFLHIKAKALLAFSYVLGFICVVLALFTNLIIVGNYRYFWGPYPKAGILHPICLMYAAYIWIFCLVSLYRGYKNKRDKENVPADLNRIKYVFWAYFFGNSAAIDYAQNYGFEFYPFGFINISIFVFIMTYAIIRHQLLDIEVVIKKTLVFAGLFVGVYALLALITFLIPFRYGSILNWIALLGNIFTTRINSFAISGLAVGVASAVMSIFVYSKGRDNKAARIWAIFCLCVAIWGFGGLCVGMIKDAGAALLAWKIAYIGVLLTPIIFFHFVCVFLNISRKPILISGYAFTVICIIVDLFGGSFFIGRVEYVFSQFYWNAKPGVVHIAFFILLFFGLTMYSLALLVKSLSYSDVQKRNQIKYFFLGTGIGWLGAELCFLPTFGILVYPYSNYLVSIYPLIMGYAILRHQLMDIKIIIKKTLIFTSLLVGMYALFMFFTFYGASIFTKIVSNRLAAIIPSVLIIALMFHPLKNFLVKITDKFLYQKKYDYKALLKVFTEEVLTVLDLNKLVNLTVDKLVDIVRVSSCAVLLFDREKDSFYIAASHNIKGEDKRLPNSIEEVKICLGAELVIPMVLNDKPIGMIALGRKKSDESYTKDDMDILQPLARTLSIALSNAELFDELAKTQAESAQKVKMAVIGTLAAGMAHEIRNPITTIKIFAEYFKEKKDDPYFIEKFQELVPREVEKINGMITHLLEFSKPADYKTMESVDLKEALNEVLEILGAEMVLNDIVLNESISTVPLVYGNKKYIQEVLFNLIQNAIHAIGRRGEISIDAEDSGKYVDVTIKDTGCGISEENIKHIFEPFFTTKMDATGVGLGLYVIKQLVTRMEGNISVESKAGVGTTFHIRFDKAK